MHVCTGLSACPKRRIERRTERRTELTDSTDNVSARLEMPGMSPASLTTSTNSDKQPSPPVNIAPTEIEQSHYCFHYDRPGYLSYGACDAQYTIAPRKYRNFSVRTALI
ncbi:hypothetical protein FRB91_006907 [Serendipita sp. 411]|nr:hypothetical protein FRB91_006907 [Serendipita sp. 411]